MERIVIDTCVLYRHLTRDILLCLATGKLYDLFLSEEIIDELARTVAENQGKDRSEFLLHRLYQYFKDSIIEKDFYNPFQKSLNYINKKDKHVAALALHVWPSRILTVDKKFQQELALHRIAYSEPDEFIAELISTTGERSIPAIKAVKELHGRKLGNQKSAEEFISMLNVNNLTKTALILNRYKNLI